ncbi:MAG: AMP-binding protein [Ignavibacteriaceae bacterium]|nr:AMP-binding protein [Ignavibacteriaceae bacterium]
MDYTEGYYPKILSIQDMLISSSKRYQNKNALFDLTDYEINSVTYDKLLDKVLSFGNALQSLGISQRTHIAIIGENRVQWGISYLTGMMFDHVVVPIDKGLSKDEVMNILYEAEAEVIIFSKSFEVMMNEIRGNLKKLKTFICMDRPENSSDYSMTELLQKHPPMDLSGLPKINPTQVAEIIFTSGSLGRAKGVMLSQHNLASNLMAMTGVVKILPTDRFLSVLPMHHTYECTCGFLCPLYCGSTVYYARSLKTVVEDLATSKATILLAVPLLYEKMYKKILKGIQEDKVKSKVVPALLKVTDSVQKFTGKDLKRKVFSQLHERFGGAIRLFIAGGAAVDPNVAKGLRGFGFSFIQGYGLTETAPILALNPIEDFLDNAAGKPLPGVTIRIDNPDSEGSGEIIAKGDNVMLGYYKRDDLTAEAIVDGWFRTGDLGFLDKKGFLHINGRKKNVIIARNGKNVYPEELEDNLHSSKYIQEAMVYADKSTGDEIISVQILPDTEAFIELSEEKGISLTKDIIEKKVKEEVNKINSGLPLHKQIKKIVIREKEFQKTTTQKIKRFLAEQDA